MIHTLSVLVEDKPGALARVTNLFSRRGYNIDELAVGPTERLGISRITMRVDCSDVTLDQIEKQMHKLVNVLKVSELKPGEAIERELLLIKVSAPPDRRSEMMALADHYKARVADLGPEEILFELVGLPEEVEAFEELLRPYGIKESARTGRVGLGRAFSKKSTPVRS